VSTHDAIILVADDEERIQDSVRDILAPEGLRCRAITSSALLLQVAEQVRPSVVLLDTRLPGGEDQNLSFRLGEVSPGCQVILLSDAGDHDLVLDGLEGGARDYLAKPLHPRETRLAVKRALVAWKSGYDGICLREGVRGLVQRSDTLIADLAEAQGDGYREILAQETVDAASVILGAGKVSLMLLDEPGHWLRVEACAGHSIPASEMDVVLPGEGVAGFALSAGTPIAVTDARKDDRFRDMVMPERYSGHSFVLVPLVAEGRAFGVLCASEAPDGKPFGDEALTLLRLVAQQFVASRVLVGVGASALGHPRALPPSERQAVPVATVGESWLDTLDVLPKSDGIQELNREGEVALGICSVVIDELDPERLLRAALASLGESLSAAPVSLYLADPNSGQLNRESMSEAGSHGDRLSLPLEIGLTGEVMRSGQALNLPDPATDARFDAAVDTPLDGRALPLLCLPIRLRGRVIGVVRAFLSEESAVVAQTAEVAAAALSAAVRTALLYRSLVSSIEEVAEARRAARA
jgi:DNA-binding response OmpR family regulator